MSEVEIECLGEFLDTYPEAEWLESHAGASRYSNGLGEGSDHESEWFCDRCELLIERDFAAFVAWGCDFCEEAE